MLIQDMSDFSSSVEVLTVDKLILWRTLMLKTNY